MRSLVTLTLAVLSWSTIFIINSFGWNYISNSFAMLAVFIGLQNIVEHFENKVIEQ